ncbi:MAG: hydroxymethylglutaryl-CoA synthase [Thermotogae bacterium]|nr:MAG: hydroxymethylglutaryl-CoA synthase [Thermotogota bacterium]
MKPLRPVGIVGYGAYIPKYRLPTTEIARIWKGGGSGPNKEKAVAGIDEDSATMAVEAARRAVEMAKVKSLGAVLVGTESKPYAVKPTATIVAEALGQHFVLAADLEFACKAGSEAMQMNIALIGSGMIENGIAIGVDTAQGRPGDELEYTAASGAAAFVFGLANDSPLAIIEESVSYISDTPDFWRRQGQPYPRHLGRFTGEPAYFHHTKTSVKKLLEITGYKPEDFKYAVFHQPNPRFPLSVGRMLGFKKEQITPGLLNPVIGNTYAASSLLGLAAVLDLAQPDDLILMASFGSGAGSDSFVIRITDAILERRKNHITVKSMIESGVRIDYAQYAKFRGKILI